MIAPQFNATVDGIDGKPPGQLRDRFYSATETPHPKEENNHHGPPPSYVREDQLTRGRSRGQSRQKMQEVKIEPVVQS